MDTHSSTKQNDPRCFPSFRTFFLFMIIVCIWQQFKLNISITANEQNKMETEMEALAILPNEEGKAETGISAHEIVPNEEGKAETGISAHEIVPNEEGKAETGIAALEVLPEEEEAKKCVSELITKARLTFGSSKATKEEKQERRQRVYIHPGPMKTGTSTIQTILTQLQEQLAMDNIFYLGKTLPGERWNCKFPHVAYCLQTVQHKDDGMCRKIIVAQLNEYYRNGVDIILSDEVFGEMFGSMALKNNVKALQDFSNILRSNDWEIRYLVGYRPFFDFFKSVYSQVFKTRNKPKLQRWPGRGGKHKPPIRDYTNLQGVFSDFSLSLFKPYADDIKVFDMTQNDYRADFTARLLCDILEDAHTACSHWKKTLDDSKILANPSYTHDYDRIATTAGSNGLVNISKHKRNAVARKVEEFAKTNNVTLLNEKLLCPTNEFMDQLRNASITKEMDIFPERQPNWETPKLFEAMRKKKKLCSVDTNALLEKDEWKNFFKQFS